MNSELRLNIIAFDIPWPPNYGGVIDVYYKIRSLAELGVKINLHCFQYGREKSDKLLEYCDNVFYYPRKLLVNPLSVNLPYIVKTRKSDLLLKNLIESEGPLLFEGLHCTYYLNRPELKNRLKIVRMHNIEYIYYKHLAKVEKKFWKKIYYNNEASCLRNYQKVLDIADHVASISPNDHKILNLKHGNSFYLPVFHPNKEVTSRVGKGEYILYHGNLGVGENNEAALFLVKNVFSELKLPTVIAGTNPSSELKRQVREQLSYKINRSGYGRDGSIIGRCTDQYFTYISGNRDQTKITQCTLPGALLYCKQQDGKKYRAVRTVYQGQQGKGYESGNYKIL